MGGGNVKKNADLEKVVYKKIVRHDEFCYWLKLIRFGNFKTNDICRKR
jgi:hypothetical protein